MQFHHTQLPNGLDVIAELKPAAHSVAIGFFVRTGSRDETSEISGVSHFLEHMAFKGDEKFSAEDVNRIFDELGASYNASTSEELTLYYAAILPEYLEQTFELLSTLIRPSLRQDDFDMEKQVILEEIGMYEDMPSFAVYDETMSAHFAGHPLGQSILGTTHSVSDLTSEQMRTYHAARYGAGNLILAVTGNADWDYILQLVEKYCSHWPAGNPGRVVEEAKPIPQIKWHTREAMNQQHVMQMAPAPAADDDLRFPAEIVGVIVGDDSTGRLYWELVETGLAESADLGYNDYDGSGTWSTYLCNSPNLTTDNLKRIAAIYHEFNENGPTQEEFDRAINKVASRVVLSGERPMGRLMTLGSNWLYRHEYRSVVDDLEILKRITLADIRKLLDKYPLGQTTTIGLGPLGEY